MKTVVILGASGAVGRQMMTCLEECEFPVRELRLLAGKRSAGSKLPYRGEEIPVLETKAEYLRGADLVFGAVSADLARYWAPAIREAGAVFIDNSSAFRMDPEVPLVIPEINGEDAKQHKGVIANPNCSTIITLMAVNRIHKRFGIRQMTACTYQAVSGAGRSGIEELEGQMRAWADGTPMQEKIFPAQILNNAIPWIGSRLENGYTTEEMKMQNEGRRILHDPELKVCCTCVRVPVMRSHSISVQITTRDRAPMDEVLRVLGDAPGCRLITELNGRTYPTPLDSTDGDTVLIGRVRRDLLDEERGIALWCCGDQIRKGAATNAVQIAGVL